MDQFWRANHSSLSLRKVSAVVNMSDRPDIRDTRVLSDKLKYMWFFIARQYTIDIAILSVRLSVRHVPHGNSIVIFSSAHGSPITVASPR